MSKRNSRKDEDEDVLILTLALDVNVKGYILIPESHPYYNAFLSKAGKIVKLPVKVGIPNEEKEQIALDLEEIPEEPETK